MSHQAVTYVKQHSRQKGGAYLCLLLIAEHARADGTNSHPGISLLAAECRLDERHVRRLVDKLEAAGEIAVERGRGRGNSHTFTVVMRPVKPDISAQKDDVKPDISSEIPDILPGLEDDKTGHFGTLKPDISDIKPDISDTRIYSKARVGEPINRHRTVRKKDPLTPTSGGTAGGNASALFIDAFKQANDGRCPDILPKNHKALKEMRQRVGEEKYSQALTGFFSDPWAQEQGFGAGTFVAQDAERWANAKPSGPARASPRNGHAPSTTITQPVTDPHDHRKHPEKYRPVTAEELRI